MRFVIFAFATIAVASAASITNDYLPPVTDISLPSQEYIAPAINTEVPTLLPIQEATQNKSILVEYLPPVTEIKPKAVVDTVPDENTIIALGIDEAPVEAVSEDKTVLADDGYHYKTIHRIRYRYRRDVSELPPHKYLPTAAESKEKAVPKLDVPLLAKAAPESTTILANDGYRYKTVRRIKYRHRRDVSELPLIQYLPPAAEPKEEVPIEVVPKTPAVITEVAPEETTILADDGYHYKTVRRLRYRHRRDVSELPSMKYLPAAAKSNENLVAEAVPKIGDPVWAVAAPDPTITLADDGYRYKTVRRLRYRHRRDVNELPLNEYLPPTAESKDDVVIAGIPDTLIAPEPPVIAETTPEDTTVLADDGYRYKPVNRIKYSDRHDGNELPLNQYLPPNAESKEEVVVESDPETLVAPEASYVDKAAPEDTTVLADDGYHYKTVRRIRYRQRRDINELLSSEYLLPVSQAIEEVGVDSIPETMQHLNLRQRRDISELPSSEYLSAALAKYTL